MYNDKESITEPILTYIQQLKQNKQEINNIENNNGMVGWFMV